MRLPISVFFPAPSLPSTLSDFVAMVPASVSSNEMCHREGRDWELVMFRAG